MKPLIGLCCGTDLERGLSFVAKAYWQAVIAAGGIPCLVPTLEEEKEIDQVLLRLNGLVLTGGPDVHPHYFKEEPLPGIGGVDPDRDRFELACLGIALERGIPLLAICRGIQVLNVALGGNVYQDIKTEVSEVLEHSQTAPGWLPWHQISFSPGSLFAKIHGAEQLTVNSFHHQAIKRVAPDLRAVGWSNDGIIEAVESESYPFVLGVQWHPERMWLQDKNYLKEFELLVEWAWEYGR